MASICSSKYGSPDGCKRPRCVKARSTGTVASTRNTYPSAKLLGVRGGYLWIGYFNAA